MPKLLTTDEFIRRAKDVHGNKFEYSNVVYIKNRTKINVICNKCGCSFFPTPYNHLKGRGCPKCSGNIKKTTGEFIEDAKKTHGDKYDYSKTNYDGNRKEICIICHEKDENGVEHGEFWQTPNAHMCGTRCPMCFKSIKKNIETFIKEACNVHGNFYDYSKAVYINNKTKICIVDPVYGEFWQIPYKHLNGQGHPKRKKESKLEKEIEKELLKRNIYFEKQKTFKWLKNEKNLYIDFYLPKYKVAIECQGIQHFKKFGWCDENEFSLIKKRDEIKNKRCKEHKIVILYFTRCDNVNLDMFKPIYKHKKELFDEINKFERNS
jgi:hypothetical protein